MQDQPTAGELLEAVQEFLKGEILPGLAEPRARFRMLVAINALGILEREFLLEGALLEAERDLLARLLVEDVGQPTTPEDLRNHVLSLNQELSGRIRSGDVPEGTLDCLKETVANKLKVASPRYLGRQESGPQDALGGP
ncbi:MAG: DUF6285 domain-containing protein [Rubrobacteraceae bacterium]